MKKRKISYDLTAQQKKKLKRQQNDGFAVAEEASSETDEAIAKRRNNKSLIICISAVILAVVLIVLAICLPIWIGSETVTNETFLNWENFNPKDPENPYTDENPNPNPPAYPIATVKLTGDDQNAFAQIFGTKELEIKIELFMDEAPYSAMNFMYLAESGYYDGTIINDLNNKHLMFCGYTNTTTNSNRAIERNFIYNLKGFYDHINANYNSDEKFKLGYRLKTEGSSRSDNLGYLVMLAGSTYGTSTGFMLLADKSPKLSFGDVGDKSGYPNIKDYLSWTGRVISDFEVLEKFNELETTINGNFLCPNNTIRISSIRTDLSSAKRNYLLQHFEELIEKGLTSTTWKNVNLNETYYNFDN